MPAALRPRAARADLAQDVRLRATADLAERVAALEARLGLTESVFPLQVLAGFIAAPLKFQGATGSSLRTLALV